MLGELLIVGASLMLLLLAAGWDAASYTIPNAIPLLLTATFAVFAIKHGYATEAIASHILAGIVGMAVGFTLFALGYVGGGDAKLFAAIVLWLGFRDFAGYAAVSAVAGGALTLVILLFRHLPLPAALASQGWIARLHDRGGGIPYGVALVAGAFVILPYTDIYRMAAH